MRLRPINSFIIVKPELTDSKFWTPEHTRRSGSAEVLEVGGDVVSVKPGDRVYFNPFSGIEIKLQGETLLILQSAEIFALDTEEASLLALAES